MIYYCAMGKQTFTQDNIDARRRFRRVAWRVATILSAALCAGVVSAATIRSKADLRLWQTVQDRAASLAWPWEEGADVATLTFSNRVTHVVSSDTISRAPGDTRGSCAQPMPLGREDVVDVTLTQTAGGRAIACESATLVYVSGAGGGPITVRVKGTRDWKRFIEARVFAVDPAWIGEAGDSGYDIAEPVYRSLKVIVR